MEVRYAGPLPLSSPLLQQLLGYQSVMHGFANWSSTRTQWLRAARKWRTAQLLDGSITQTAETAEAAAAAAALVAQRSLLPLDPSLLAGIMHWDRAAASSIRPSSETGSNTITNNSSGGADCEVTAAPQWKPPDSMAWLLVPLKEGVVGGAATVDWAAVDEAGRGLQPVSVLLAQALGEQVPSPVEPELMPPSAPPPAPHTPEARAALGARAAAGPLRGAAAMAPLPSRARAGDARTLAALDAVVRSRIVIAGHSSQVLQVVGVTPCDVTPTTDMKAYVQGLMRELDAADTVLCGSSASSREGLLPALNGQSAAVAAGVVLASAMAAHDPVGRPPLGWLAGRDEEGGPLWAEVDSHAQYYCVRCGISGLRADVPLLLVSNSRSLPDCSLLPPQARARSGISDSHDHLAAAYASAAAKHSHYSVDVVRKRPSPTSASSFYSAEAAANDPGSMHKVCASGKRFRGPHEGDVFGAAALEPPTTPTSAAADNWSGEEHPHFQRPAATQLVALRDAVCKQVSALAGLNRRTRHAEWARHRMGYLPLELAWVLPITVRAWGELQLLPSLMQRLNGVLQATALHVQLGTLLHGTALAPAGGIAGDIAPPGADDTAAAIEAGWQPPDSVASVLREAMPRALQCLNAADKWRTASEGAPPVPVPPPPMLLAALTCASVGDSFQLERLEFLGDVVLKLLAAQCLLTVSTTARIALSGALQLCLTCHASAAISLTAAAFAVACTAAVCRCCHATQTRASCQ